MISFTDSSTDDLGISTMFHIKTAKELAQIQDQKRHDFRF